MEASLKKFLDFRVNIMKNLENAVYRLSVWQNFLKEKGLYRATTPNLEPNFGMGEVIWRPIEKEIILMTQTLENFFRIIQNLRRRRDL